MRYGLPISIAVHMAVLAWALLSVSATRELKTPEIVPLDVALMTIKDFDNLRKGDRKSKEVAKPVAAKDDPKPVLKEDKESKRVATLAPPKAEEPVPEVKKEVPKPEPKPEPKKEEVKKEEPKPVPTPEPKPEPKKEEPKPDPIAEAIKKAALEPEPPKKEEPKKEEPKLEPKKEEAKKPEPKKEEPKKVAKTAEPKKKKKEQFDPDKISALLNKLPNAASKPSTKTDNPAASEEALAVLGAETSTGNELTISEQRAMIALIISKLKTCWSPPVGSVGADAILVTLRFRLHEDGSVDGLPQVVNTEGSALFQLAAESAMRAIMECQPYDTLPPDKYEGGWQSVTLNFIPRDMFGG